MGNYLGNTISDFVRVFPEYGVYENGGTFDEPNWKYRKLYDLFSEKMTERHVRWFRAMWHNWRVEKDEEAGKKIKDFIKVYLED